MLQIINVNLIDQGLYTCIARTDLDEDNATAILTVLGKIILECIYFIQIVWLSWLSNEPLLLNM